MNSLEKFSLITGVVGLVADTIAILSFATGLGLLLPEIRFLKTTPEGGLFVTAIVEMYAITMVMFYLLRRKHANENKPQPQLDEMSQELGPIMILFSLLPGMGAIFLIGAAGDILLLAFFIVFLPAALWSYVLFGSTDSALGYGVFGSILIAQYATLFALVLDEFFD